MEELSHLRLKLQEEKAALDVCRAKVAQRQLPMQVIGAEYQFDRHKLTFYFEAAKRIDFRQLVRDLFSIYKTRIWLQQLSHAQRHNSVPTQQQFHGDSSSNNSSVGVGKGNTTNNIGSTSASGSG